MHRNTYILAALGLLLGCGPAVRAFDIVEVIESDCSQGESGQINCIDPENFQNVEARGRWTVELIGGDKFVLTTETGRVLPGVHFANTGGIASDSCTGQGGRCFFTRSRTDAVDAQTGCTRIDERVIDVFVDEGTLVGRATDVQFVDGCDSANVRQVLINVNGIEAQEPVSAREGL